MNLSANDAQMLQVVIVAVSTHPAAHRGGHMIWLMCGRLSARMKI